MKSGWTASVAMAPELMIKVRLAMLESGVKCQIEVKMNDVVWHRTRVEEGRIIMARGILVSSNGL